MLRRYIAIFLLLAAYTILLGHSIVPHHHHHDEHTGHNLAHHYDNDDAHGLHNIFTHFLHLSDDLSFLDTSADYLDYNKQLLLAFVLPEKFAAGQALTAPLSFLFPPPPSLPASPYFCSAGLRGPPALMG